MPHRIESIAGIGPASAFRLRQAGITSTADLLRLCGEPKGRRMVSARTGISQAQLLTWAHSADLMRVPGVDAAVCAQLRFAGVDSLGSLRQQQVEALRERLQQVRRARRLNLQMASAESIEDWIALARQLASHVD